MFQPVYRSKIGAIDSIVHDLNALGAEALARQGGVGLADRNDAIGLGEHAPLEALELAPLTADVPALQWMSFGFMVALPDQRIDVVGHQYSAGALRPAEHIQERRPLELPEISTPVCLVFLNRLAHQGAIVRSHRIRQRRHEIGGQACVKGHALLARQRLIDDVRRNAVVAQEGFGSLHLFAAAVAAGNISNATAAREAQHQIQRPQTLAARRRIRYVTVHDGHVHHHAQLYLANQPRMDARPFTYKTILETDKG